MLILLGIDEQDDEKYNKCMKALFMTDPESDLLDTKDAKDEWAPGSCDYIKGQPEYLRWISGTSSHILRLEGGEGTGKTVLSTFLVDELKKKVERSASDGLFAFYFCTNNEDNRNTAFAILRSLIRQLLSQRKDLLQHVLKEFESKDVAAFKDVHGLWRMLMSMLKDDDVNNVMLLIDGLDECHDSTRDKLLSDLRRLPKQGFEPSKARFLICSRPGLKYDDAFDCIRIEEVERGVGDFIVSRVEDTAAKHDWSPELADDIKDHLLSHANGAYLFVRFFLDHAMAGLDVSTIQLGLDNNTLPKTLHSIFEDILLGFSAEKREPAAWLLRNVACAASPFTEKELTMLRHVEQHGLNDYTLPEMDAIESIDELQELCDPFLTRTSKGPHIIVNFEHQSVRDFMTSEQLRDNKNLSDFYAEASLVNWSLFKACAIVLSTKELDDVANGLERQAELDELDAAFYNTTGPECLWCGFPSKCIQEVAC